MLRGLRIASCLGALALVALLASCDDDVILPAEDGLEAGTWGGENVGVTVSDSVAHVHVGCTYGNFTLPWAFDREGRFEADGSYLLRAYPIAVGPTMPARIAGQLEGDELTFTVTVNDTVAKQTSVLGPATVIRGREPKLGPCPICTSIPAMR